MPSSNRRNDGAGSKHESKSPIKKESHDDLESSSNSSSNKSHLQQRQMQRKKLKRYESDDSSSSEEENKETSDITTKKDPLVKVEENDTSHSSKNKDDVQEEPIQLQTDLKFKLEDGASQELQGEGIHSLETVAGVTEDTNLADNTTTTDNVDNDVIGTNNDNNDDTNNNTNNTTTKQIISATDAISEVANQSLNSELTLLQTFEKKGVMNEVFGSQSLLSQELQGFHNHTNQYSLSQCSIQSIPMKDIVEEHNGKEEDEQEEASTTSEKKSEKKKQMQKQVLSSRSQKLKASLEDDDDYSSTTSSTAKTVSTHKLASNETDPPQSAPIKEEENDEHPNDTPTTENSQTSFVIHSLPQLSVPETQVISDTQPNSQNMTSLSQSSTLSGYDLIINAAQTLAEQDKELECNENENDYGDAASKCKVPPVPPLPTINGNVTSDSKMTKHALNPTSISSRSSRSSRSNSPHVNSLVGKLPPQSKDAKKKTASISTRASATISSISTTTTNSHQTRKRARPDTKDPISSASPEKIPRSNPIKSHSPTPTPQSTTPPPPSSSAGYIRTNGTTYTVRKTKAQRKKLQEETNYTARRAASLVEQLRIDAKVEKQLLLSMALTRENPRSGPSSYPSHGTVIVNGFYWGQFPPLEKVLRSYMEEYYELSIEKCQSRTQQAFNNKLVALIQTEASKHGWSFDEGAFDEKKIRDRIRCFFKTHIQNAKKRLKTMVRNPLKRANAKALANHLDLIEKCEIMEKLENTEGGDPNGGGGRGGGVTGGETAAKVEGSKCKIEDGTTMPALTVPTSSTSSKNLSKSGGIAAANSNDSHNSRNIYDSNAHDAAQVVRCLYIYIYVFW